MPHWPTSPLAHHAEHVLGRGWVCYRCHPILLLLRLLLQFMQGVVV